MLKGKAAVCKPYLLAAALLLGGIHNALASYPWPIDLEGPLEAIIDGEIESRVEDVTQLNIQENIEDKVEDTIEQSVDASVEGTIDDVVAQSVEERLEESVESMVQTDVAETVQSAVEQSVEESIEVAVVSAVEVSVEEAVESELVASVESGIEAAVESTLEASVEDDVQAAVEDSVADAVEGALEDSVADAVAQEVDDDVQIALEAALESSVEGDVEQRVVLAIESRVETEIDEILDNLESDLEVDERRILKEQWLVMAEPAVFEELSSRGYLFEMVTELPGLGLRLAEVAAPSTFDIRDVRDGVLDVVGKDRAEVDLNHIYTAGTVAEIASTGVMPRVAMPFPGDLDEMELRVGMIDSGVDTSHPALVDSKIKLRSFARSGAETPAFHGTAIASIIAANSPDYKGLAPNAEVFAASVFEVDGKRGEIASTVSLIKALDWLISSEVDVVNISLAGPANRLLERALDRAAKQDMVIMAAAGNGGPVAKPMYPAAYDSVVAVTAVDSARRVFRLANRGEYLALSAPGVDLRHAQSGGGYAASSGTSFAVPFAVTAAARLGRLQPESDIVSMLLNSATDLGAPGRDSVYGYGLLTLGSL